MVLAAGVALAGGGAGGRAAWADDRSPLDKAKSAKAKGDFLKETGALDDAAVSYRSALLSKPDFTDAREALALLLARSGRYDEALFEIEEGMRRDAAWKKGLFHLARVNQMAGRWPEATLHYRMFLDRAAKDKKAKKDPDALRGLAQCLTEMGERVAAIAAWDAYLKAEKRKTEAPSVAAAKEAVAKLRAGPAPAVIDFDAPDATPGSPPILPFPEGPVPATAGTGPIMAFDESAPPPADKGAGMFPLEASPAKPLLPFPASDGTPVAPGKPLSPFPLDDAAKSPKGDDAAKSPKGDDAAKSPKGDAPPAPPVAPPPPPEAPLVDSSPKAPEPAPEVPTVDVSGDLAAGDVAFTRGDFRTAEALYLGATELAIFHAEAWYKLGVARVLLGQVDPAIAAWKWAVALDPENTGLRARLSRLYELRARMAEHGSIAKPKGAPPPEMRLIGAEDLLASGRPSLALAEADAVRAARPGSADVHMTRGHALVALGRYDEAADSYRLARATEPGWAAPLKALGDLYRRAGEERLMRYHYELFLWAAERSSRPEDAADVDAVKAILGAP